MKKMRAAKILGLSFLIFSQTALAASTPPKNLSQSYKANTYQVAAKTTTPPPHTEFRECIKTYPLSTESLLYMCLSALSINNYKIDEIQFRTGTILFTAYSKEFILTTSRKNIRNSFVKILPVDNNYNFSPITINKIYTYIDLNSGLGIQSVI